MTSTSFNVGMSLDRSSSKTNKDDESASSDSESDEDYVPSTKELKENDVASEENSEEGGGDDDDDDKYEDGKLGKRRKPSSSRRKRQKIVDSVEEPEELKPEETSAPANIDDLWNEFKKDCAVPTSTKKASSVVEDEDSKADTSSETEKPKPKTKTVTELFEFAGEAVEVKKEVPVETLELPTIVKRPASTSRGGVLSSVLGQLGKKNKLSVLEKSKLDWEGFKEKEGINEQLQSHNKGKAGYLEKQDFLQRADVRQFEIEKAMRSSRRLK